MSRRCPAASPASASASCPAAGPSASAAGTIAPTSASTPRMHRCAAAASPTCSAAENRAPMRDTPRVIVWLLIALAVIVADQATKQLVENGLALGGAVY